MTERRRAKSRLLRSLQTLLKTVRVLRSSDLWVLRMFICLWVTGILGIGRVFGIWSVETQEEAGRHYNMLNMQKLRVLLEHFIVSFSFFLSVIFQSNPQMTSLTNQKPPLRLTLGVLILLYWCRPVDWQWSMLLPLTGLVLLSFWLWRGKRYT